MLDTKLDSDFPDAPPTADLGPLAWVFEELRKSMEGANKALRRFIREAEQARHGDLESADVGALRLAGQQLHQTMGALEMVGLLAPAQVVRAMEAAVRRCVQKPKLCTEEAANRIERASFALIEYLSAVLNNKPVQPVSLFTQYRDVQELAAAERVHPADLWPFDQRGTEVAAPVGVARMDANAQMRSLFDRVLLLMIRSHSPAAAAQLARMSGGLSAGAEVARVTTFWHVAAAYFEAMAHGLIPADLYVKRAASRILLQLASLIQEKSRNEVSETLLHDLLFFCSQAQPSGAATPFLLAVRQAFGLSDAVAVDYTQATLGRFDPALLTQARKRIKAGKECWTLLSGGDVSRARQVHDQYSLISESLLKLHPSSSLLARALVKSAEQVARAPAMLRPELSMEMATTTLYLEAVFENFDPADQTLASRTQSLAERLERVMAGEPSQALESWMEELYRSVSDRQTLGSVVGELKVALGEAEKSLDQFFRAPQDKSGLNTAVSHLMQMRGVMSVLGLQQAVQAVVHMRAQVEKILETEDDALPELHTGVFQQLGNNLSALSFLVDMLNYQPLLAKKLFVFDVSLGELKPLMGRTHDAPPRFQAAQHDAMSLSAGVQRVVEAAQNHELNLADLRSHLGSLADQASLVDHQGVAQAARAAANAVMGDDSQAGANALIDLAQFDPLPTPEQPPAGPEDIGEDDGDDVRDIFIEEAGEVLAQGRSALAVLGHDRSQLEHLTTLRRAFHTLKGSSRMVGLMEFGEAAWAMEQVFNAVLADQATVEKPLRSLAEEALAELTRWRDDIARNRDAGWSAQPFRASAAAWRDAGQYLPIFAADEILPVAEAAKTEDAAIVGRSLEVPDLPVLEDWEVIDAADIDRDTGVETLASLQGEPRDFSVAQKEGLSQSWGGDGEGAAHPVQELSLPDSQEPASIGEDPDLYAATGEMLSVQDNTDERGPAVADEMAQLENGLVDAGGHVFQPDLSLSAGEAEKSNRAPIERLDEQMRRIGPLRIGIPLYNVYLNEADEWSRRLSTCLGEWVLERHEPIPEAAEAWAHSLAGSSATVGFQPLSDIARALEHALASVALHQQAGQVATAEHAQLFVDAADNIRHLLHQFAAGFFKEPQADLLPALLQTAHGFLLQDADSVWRAAFSVPHPVHPSQGDETGGPDAAPVPRVSLLTAESVARGPAQDIDDDIDAIDTIDVDLFPIFSEEALELLPRLGGALRQWKAHPDNDSARGEVLRNLHTFKGSARLAGALRLGEMAHRMETAVERLGTDRTLMATLEPLQRDYDALCARFDRLRSDEPDSMGVVQTAPEQGSKPFDVLSVSTEMAESAAALVVPGNRDAVVRYDGPGLTGLELVQAPVLAQHRAGAAVRVRPELLDRLVNQTGEVMITRSRLESQLVTLRGSLKDLTGNLDRLRHQLRDVELQAETQMQSRLAQARDAELTFDPLEFDRFTRVQELTRMMAESVNDVATVQRNLQRAVEATEDGLVAQGRQTRELQRDLLRTRMVEFEGISERLYRVVRQASKETGKQVRLDIVGGQIEMDRGVLDRMTAAFEHLLRNSVVHGIETPEQRIALGKTADGHIEIRLAQEINDVSVVFRDDGAGLDLKRLREKAVLQGLVASDASLPDDEIAQFVFAPGLSTADKISPLAGRGVGMDVVRTDVVALGGRIETQSQDGQGCSFKLVLPLTTAVTQVVMLRAGTLTMGVPSTQVELVRRVGADELAQAYSTHSLVVGDEAVPFFWAGALLQSSAQSSEPQGRTLPVVIFRSAAQRVALHVDEVLGNQEVVVKNLGPQLSRLPGLAGMSVLASGAVALIYNPVALAAVYGPQVLSWIDVQHRAMPKAVGADAGLPVEMVASTVPLVLVVDDSITVRRVTQRLLQREGYRVALAADGLQALERLQQERPSVVLSDIEMPRMDGFDLVRNIRSDPRLAQLPVIMITSRIAEKHREHARELGVNHYLGKPYSEEELVALIGHYAQVSAEAGEQALI